MHLSAQKTLAISKLAGIVMLVGVLAATSATGVLVYNYTKGPANVNESCTSTTIEFNNYTQAIAFDPKNHDIYVGVAPNHVEVVSDATNKVIKELTVSGHIITSISYNPANGLLYAAQQLTLDNTTIIDGSTNNIVGSLSFEAPVPNADTYNPSLGIYYYDYFLFSYPSNTILAVSATTNKIVQNISLGSQSSAGYLLYNDVNGRLYSFSNNWAYSIDPVSGVVVSKINLGANVSWYALD
ncbi:MAG: YncE family protein, partial [Nitrososphaerales archaeon]